MYFQNISTPLTLGVQLLNEHKPPPSHTPSPSPTNYEQQPHGACERTKSKQKQKQNQVAPCSNWPHVLLFDLANKQRNSIITGWLHCLTPESIGKLLVNNILMFDSA